MVGYKLSSSDKRERLIPSNAKDWSKNLSTLLEWSPYSTEADLLEQFDDIGLHGTKVIIYNLWLNDDGQKELDFESNNEDIQLRGSFKVGNSGVGKRLSENHIANRLRYSLRAYLSVLYLEMRPNFKIILRGRRVAHHRIVDDLKFQETIVYKPQALGIKEASVRTTIGFTKEAPFINVQGFSVYHRNRLILPFWIVGKGSSSRGRGVVGVLEANFMVPAHDKQGFRKTPVFYKLETRLKQMTNKYWNLHCELLGYKKPPKKRKISYLSLCDSESLKTGLCVEKDSIRDVQTTSCDAAVGCIPTLGRLSSTEDQTVNNHEVEELREENRKLNVQIHEYEARLEKSQQMVIDLESALQQIRDVYAKLLIESQSLANVKLET